jgi:hypothetical protein
MTHAPAGLVTEGAHRCCMAGTTVPGASPTAPPLPRPSRFRLRPPLLTRGDPRPLGRDSAGSHDGAFTPHPPSERHGGLPLHARAPHPTERPHQGRPQRSRQPLTWTMLRTALLPLTWVVPPLVQTKTFHGGATDVQCRLDAVTEAHMNGQNNRIDLDAGVSTGPATASHKRLSGTSRLIITGAGADLPIIQRTPPSRILFVEPTVVTQFEKCAS